MLERQLSEEAAKNLALNEMKNLDLSHTPSTSLRTGFEMTKNHFNSNTNVFSSKTRNLDLSRSFEMTPLVPDLSHPPLPLAQDRVRNATLCQIASGGPLRLRSWSSQL